MEKTFVVPYCPHLSRGSQLRTARGGMRTMTYPEIVRMIPRRMYKYQQINPNTLDGLRNHRLWFSAPERFNDPFDCKVSCFLGRNKQDFETRLESFFGPSDPMARLLKKSDAGWQQKNEALMLCFHQFYSRTIHVCALSTEWDNVLMWSHYANQHKGMCLVFDSYKAGLIRDNVVPVQYFAKYPAYLVDARRIGNLEMLAKQLLAVKSAEWEYEHEWRAFMVNEKNDRKSSKGALHEYDPSLLVGIVFGINTSPAARKKVEKALAQRSSRSHVKLYQARAVQGDFRISVREIERT